MYRFRLFLICLMVFSQWFSTSSEALPPTNLLLNPSLNFHSFENSRTGQSAEFKSGAIACWNQDAYGDAEVYRATRQTAFRPIFAVDNVVVLHPGKSLHQFALLAELGLDGGEEVSLSVFGRQAKPGSLRAAIRMMRLDSEEGTWSPKDFGGSDTRTFPKHARGELNVATVFSQASGEAADFEIKVEKAVIPFGFTESSTKSTSEPNVIGITVEFNNIGTEDVWLYSPTLSRGAQAERRLPEERPMPEHYRSLPRTIQKLWRGEPLHILVMGSSIDRGSANPAMVPYNEDPASPTFKQPLSKSRDFEGALLAHPEWNERTAWWQHHFMYAGRLRQLLMQKFNYPMERLLLNTMACDGSCIAESHSGLEPYAALSLPPAAGVNGHPEGRSWQDLYPSVFTRAEGPGPDLVIFGSGANEKVDGAHEVAAFEGAIRWFQRNHPAVEFVFCMWQNRETYTPNTGHLQELALRYQIPFLDVGRVLSETTRYCNSFALVPSDGHPQAAAHYLWAKQLERAFDAAGPILPGILQQHLPSRLSEYTIGWEGEISTYAATSPRIHQRTGVILDDTFVNLWAKSQEKEVTVVVDGAIDKGSRRRPSNGRDSRNSTFATGRLSLGDRHIVEVAGDDASIVAVDSKPALQRQWHPVENPRWKLPSKTEPFASEWGAPYGNTLTKLPASSEASLDFVGTDLSIAYVDAPAGGEMEVWMDGREVLRIPTNQAFVSASGAPHFMENRRAIRAVSYGWHRVQIKTNGAPVQLLGAFSYDTRSNRQNERVERGQATPGESIRFSASFKSRPWVVCNGGLRVNLNDATSAGVTFSGVGEGGYEVIGE